MKNAYAFCFKEARSSTTIGSDIEHNRLCGQVSTFMKVISNKDGDLTSQFYNINGNNIPVLERYLNLPSQIRDTPHQKTLINNHTDANKVKIKGFLHLEDIFGFSKTFKKVSKKLGFHLMLKTNDSQDFIFISMDDEIMVTIINLFLLVPNFIPTVEIQLTFHEATQNIYKKTFKE